MSPLAGTLLVWRHAFATMFRGKRLVALLMLAGLPLLVSALNVTHAREVAQRDFVFAFLLVLCQVTVPFSALFLGVAVLGDEVDGRTITYLFTRPLPRWVFYLGRMLGFACAFGLIIAATVLACVQLYSGRTGFTAVQVAAPVGIALGGFLAYLAFFAALRTLTKKALFVGFFITFVVEMGLSKLPAGALTRLSVWHHLSLLMARTFEGQVELEGPLANVTKAETVGGSVTVVLCVFLVSLLVGCWLVKTREVHVPAAAA